jgi:hypothetical protein
MKIRPVRRFVQCGRTDGQTDTTKLLVAFHNFANTLKYDSRLPKTFRRIASNLKLITLI